MPAGHDISASSDDLLPTVYIAARDETLPANTQVVLEDYYEINENVSLELAIGSMMYLQADPSPIMGVDASGAFLEIIA